VLSRAGIQLNGPTIGKDISTIIQHNSFRSFESEYNEKVNEIWNKLQSGDSFWDAVKKPYLKRDLNRGQVKETIQRALQIGDGTYKNILNTLNIKQEDYKRFLNFINDNNLKQTLNDKQ
jgi:hypothetical protein